MGERLNVVPSAPCRASPAHVPRARIDFAEWFAVDHESRRPASCISSVGQEYDDVPADRPRNSARRVYGIEHGQPESSPGLGSLLQKYRDKKENIIFIDVLSS